MRCLACGGRAEKGRGVSGEPVPGWWGCADEACGTRCRERPGGDREYSRFASAPAGTGFGFSGTSDETTCPRGCLFVRVRAESGASCKGHAFEVEGGTRCVEGRGGGGPRLRGTLCPSGLLFVPPGGREESCGKSGEFPEEGSG